MFFVYLFFAMGFAEWYTAKKHLKQNKLAYFTHRNAMFMFLFLALGIWLESLFLFIPSVLFFGLTLYYEMKERKTRG